MTRESYCCRLTMQNLVRQNKKLMRLPEFWLGGTPIGNT